MRTTETYSVGCKKTLQTKTLVLEEQLMAVSNCAIFDKKKSKFIKSQQASRLELH